MQEAAGRPSLVLFDGFNAEERFGHYVHEALPDAMRVLDMQDFHALRLGREQLVAEGASAEAVATFRPAAGNEDLQRELAAIHRCDATLAISEDEERRLLLETYGVPGWKVFAAPFGFKPSSSSPGFAAREGAMFIGTNWRHRPNRDCARWLIQEVWPLVRRELPDEELNVFGANQTPADAALSDPSRGAFVRGYCRSVEAMMRRHKVLVAPLRYGAGVKGKVLEAMLHGSIVVTTPVGVEGIADPEAFPGYVVDNGGEDAAAFAEVVVQALREQRRWEALQQEAASFISEHFDEAKLGKSLLDFLTEARAQLPQNRLRDFVGQMLWHSSLRSTQLMAKYIAAKEEHQALERRTAAGGRSCGDTQSSTAMQKRCEKGSHAAAQRVAVILDSTASPSNERWECLSPGKIHGAHCQALQQLRGSGSMGAGGHSPQPSSGKTDQASSRRTPMSASASAPELRASGPMSGSMRKTLRPRGENDFGMVPGVPAEDDVYVPRAMWTDTADNPMKQEDKRIAQKLAMKEFYRKEPLALAGQAVRLAKQIEDNKALRQAQKGELQDMAKTVTAATMQMERREQAEKEELQRKREKMRQGLDEQMALLEERAKEARLQDLLEGAETKARSMQMLYEEMETQKKLKQELKKRGDEMRQEVARRAGQKSSDRQLEREELQERMRQDEIQEEYRQSLKQKRIRAHQARSDAREVNYFQTAGRERQQREESEAARLDRDEHQHNLRFDLHHSRRAAARKQQQQKVLADMRLQSLGIKTCGRGSKEREREANGAAARLCSEAELQKAKKKRQQELAMQAELAKMMIEKQRTREKEEEGPKSRITPMCSMAVDQTFVDMAVARAAGSTMPKSFKPMHQVDAAKDLSKPMGKPRVKPWVDIQKSHGPGGVVGTFGGEGRTHLSLMASGGAKRILTENTARKTWSEGLQAAELKAGERVAQQRHHAQLVDKTDRF
ncbi:unnamed protein product [Effrenium voratum]|uniref:Glycosyltransferase n=1 Tax=Effrenium voratum TaxID=2562239 RepID=A0AA36I5P9_9DINO|nr:unnamed protein product [Effrenium voratum]